MLLLGGMFSLAIWSFFVSQWRWSSLAWLLGYDSFLFVLHAVALLQYGDGIAGSSKLQLWFNLIRTSCDRHNSFLLPCGGIFPLLFVSALWWNLFCFLIKFPLSSLLKMLKWLISTVIALCWVWFLLKIFELVKFSDRLSVNLLNGMWIWVQALISSFCELGCR